MPEGKVYGVLLFEYAIEKIMQFLLTSVKVA